MECPAVAIQTFVFQMKTLLPVNNLVNHFLLKVLIYLN